MRKIVAAGLAGAFVLSGAALAADPPLQVSYPTDATLDCAGLAAELLRMDTVIAEANKDISSAGASAQGAGIANAVATEGLVRSGALGGLGAFGGLAARGLAAAQQKAQQGAANKAALAQETIKTAETRKLLIGGLSTGKACAPAG